MTGLNDSAPLSIEEQLAAIEAEEADERRAASAAADAKRIARHALKKRMMAELKGKEGEAFAIVDSLGGFIVVKKPEGVRWKAFTKSERNDPDVENLIRPCVVTPEWDRVAAIIDDYPGTKDEIVAPLVAMIGVVLEGRAKK